MPRYFFDLETNGFLDVTDRVHSLVLQDVDTGEVLSCANQPGFVSLQEGVERLATAEMICGHNIIGFDLPVLRKLYPGFSPQGDVQDTLVMARLIYPTDHLRDWDMRLRHKQASGGENTRPTFPATLIGRHSLEAFGHRLGLLKGDYATEMKAQGLDPWATWNPAMQDYCQLDVRVTSILYQKMLETKPSQVALDLEHAVAPIIFRQQQHGFLFDLKGAHALHGELIQRKVELERELQNTFKPWVVEKLFTPKVNNKKLGYTKGVTVIKRKTVVFNPGSRDHIANRLEALYDWRPSEFTKTGKPKIDDEVLGALPWPETKILAEYLMIEKRLGALLEGAQSWLRLVKDTGRIHGSVITNGAVTGRMTHQRPNMAQVPSTRAPYGLQCRSLFTVPEGKRLVGCDASALELRCLASYMSLYDEGKYQRVVLDGTKEEGTDIHSVNARALGLDPKQSYAVQGKNQSGRDLSKTWFYAFIYGAGDEKLGTVLGLPAGPKACKRGKTSRASFLKNLPALGKLVADVQRAVKERGYLRGLDGRILKIRSAHAALNTLLQSAGAVLMKKALVICDRGLNDAGYHPGRHYEFVANVHDEFQIEINEDIADAVGLIAKASIGKAGEALSFRCPLDGDYSIGKTWADTH